MVPGRVYTHIMTRERNICSNAVSMLMLVRRLGRFGTDGVVVIMAEAAGFKRLVDLARQAKRAELVLTPKGAPWEEPCRM